MMKWNHRNFVGPEDRFYTYGAHNFIHLVSRGLKPNHTVLDVGCGSMRVGRELIPYLDKSCYFGIEPEEEMVQAGLLNELSSVMVAQKSPRFLYVDDFGIEGFGIPMVFRWIIALQVFIHCGEDQLRDFLKKCGQRCDRMIITVKIDSGQPVLESPWPKGIRNIRYPGSDFMNTTYSKKAIRAIIKEADMNIIDTREFRDSAILFELKPNNPIYEFKD